MPPPKFAQAVLANTPSQADLDRLAEIGNVPHIQADGYWFIVFPLAGYTPEYDAELKAHPNFMADQSRAPVGKPGIEWHESIPHPDGWIVHRHVIQDGVGYVPPVSEVEP